MDEATPNKGAVEDGDGDGRGGYPLSVDQAGRVPRRRTSDAAMRLVAFKLGLLDLVIALGRKVGGFCGLLLLGWLYVRLLVLGHSPHRIYPDAADPDLRQTLWVALFLIMAQGWDIPTDTIIEHWVAVKARWPTNQRAKRVPSPSSPAARRRWHVVWRAAGPTVVPIITWLERFMDLCVAIANKVGALGVLVYLTFLAWEGLCGVTARAMYPDAADPVVSLLADVCVYVVVLGWWATPLEQIALFWRSLRGTG